MLWQQEGQSVVLEWGVWRNKRGGVEEESAQVGAGASLDERAGRADKAGNTDPEESDRLPGQPEVLGAGEGLLREVQMRLQFQVVGLYHSPDNRRQAGRQGVLAGSQPEDEAPARPPVVQP